MATAPQTDSPAVTYPEASTDSIKDPEDNGLIMGGTAPPTRTDSVKYPEGNELMGVLSADRAKQSLHIAFKVLRHTRDVVRERQQTQQQDGLVGWGNEELPHGPWWSLMSCEEEWNNWCKQKGLSGGVVGNGCITGTSVHGPQY